MFQLPLDFVSGSLGRFSELFNDMKPFLLLVFGIGIGMWIADIILNLIERRVMRKRRSAELEEGLEAEEN